MQQSKIMVRLAIAAGVGSGAFLWYQNNKVQTTSLTYRNASIPENFDGYRILQISDLHNKLFGQGQWYLAEKMEQADPDVIVITGDIIDTSAMNNALALAQRALEIAPVYYVAGNHEKRYHCYGILRKKLETAGVRVLDNERVALQKGTQQIVLIGMKDPSFFAPDEETADRLFENKLAALTRQGDGLQILLSHRPEKYMIYEKQGIDLVFCGHAHGGQFRLPGIGALMSPGQGAFPKYTSGIHRFGTTSMVVSRGLGNSAFPVRLFNQPELVVLTLDKREGQ